MLVQFDVIVFVEMGQVVVLLFYPLHAGLLLLELANWSKFAYYTFDLHSVSILIIIVKGHFIAF